MSYYMYKDKKFIETPDGKILPLILVADSCVTDGTRKHPAHWCIQTLGCEAALLVDKKLFQEAADKEVQSRIDWLDKNYPDSMHGLDDYNPYCDTYRGNSKIRGMKSFLSAKRTISAEEFLSFNRFSVSLQPRDTKKEKNKETQRFFITNLDDLKALDRWYRKHREEYPDDVIYIGVRGLPGED